jgi:hypothetical protein
MARVNGGTKVGAGFYWRSAEWEIVTLSGQGGTLPGGAGEVYHRIPTLAMLAAAPVMGALFVMFLPFIGIAMALKHFGALALEASREAAIAVGATLVPAWRPGEAYLAHGDDAEPAGDEPKAESDPLSDVEQQIAARRK